MVLQADYIRAGVTQVRLPADTCKSMMGKRISRMVGQALLMFVTRIYSDGNVDYTTELAGGKFDETFQEEDLQLDKLKTGVGGGAGFSPPGLQLPRENLKAVVQVPMLTVLHMDMTDKQQWVEMLNRLMIHNWVV